MKNSLFTIQPYQHGGLWVFDDATTGLVREPFVCGIDDMLDFLTADIPGAASGFNLVFSSDPFPGHTVQLDFVRRGEQGIGNYYAMVKPVLAGLKPPQGWLCPALLLYYPQPPKSLYAQVSPIRTPNIFANPGKTRNQKQKAK